MENDISLHREVGMGRIEYRAFNCIEMSQEIVDVIEERRQ